MNDERFVDKNPSLETYWRAIILLGVNNASYKFALKNEDSAKFPFAKMEFIIMLLSSITLIKLINDKLEFGIYALLKSCPSEN